MGLYCKVYVFKGRLIVAGIGKGKVFDFYFLGLTLFGNLFAIAYLEFSLKKFTVLFNHFSSFGENGNSPYCKEVD